ncbi:unnamed protein product [Diamesa tonsa]
MENQEFRGCNAIDGSNIKTLPKVVHDLQFYDGDSTELADWIDDGDIIIGLFSLYEGTPDYQVILNAMRSKIVGEANAFLIENKTILSWKCIKNDLQKHLLARFQLMELNAQSIELKKCYAKIMEIQDMLISCLCYEDGNIKFYQ